MSHTNTTTNYGLPQFITTDKPAWLTDVNVAYTAIDTAIKNADDKAVNAQNDASQAISDASSASSTATSADAKATGAIASIAESFEPTATYSVGEYVMYNNLLYVCTTAVTVPGIWDSTKWTRITCDNIFGILDSKINNLNGNTLINDPVSSPSQTIAQKIASVDNSKANVSIEDIIPSFIHSNIGTNGMKFHRFGNMLFFSGYFSGTNIPRYTAIFTLNGILAETAFVPLVCPDVGSGYMEVYTASGNTNFRISNLPANASGNTVFTGCVKIV